uniref:Uncharacterized protein n=1 Tax=Anopheles dirus TaxID=7168 RepID=A0A182NX71_9DIPT
MDHRQRPVDRLVARAFVTYLPQTAVGYGFAPRPGRA